jgi:hypothetical protein
LIAERQRRRTLLAERREALRNRRRAAKEGRAGVGELSGTPDLPPSV